MTKSIYDEIEWLLYDLDEWIGEQPLCSQAQLIQWEQTKYTNESTTKQTKAQPMNFLIYNLDD